MGHTVVVLRRAAAVLACALPVAAQHELHKLLPADGTANDRFGHSVSLDGGLALVGAFYSWHCPGVYVFDATTSQELLELLPSDGEDDDSFGYSVFLDDGLALVGAYKDDYDNKTNAGSAYVFDTTTGLGLLKLTPSDAATSDGFGYSVCLDGNVALVGAVFDDDNGDASGSASLFDVTSGQELLKLIASDGARSDQFGHNVSLDGDLALLGAWGNDDNGFSSGSAYIFDLHAPGVGYCFGDPGSGSPCPCSNDNDGSVPGSGCANGVFASFAQLTGSGVASVSGDTLVLATTGLEPSNSGLYFQANNDLSPGSIWGDGLQCAGGQLRRLGVRFSDASGYSDTSGYSQPISVKAGNVVAGDTKYYQCWYRNPLSSPCGSKFNASNGYAVTWLP